MEKLLTSRNTVILVSVLTLWRLYLSAALQLHPDEAYYWLWSRNLDISYFDHPPMVAYFIRLTTLVSQSEAWVRLSGTLVFLVTSGLLWRLSMQLFGSVAIAASSVILLNVYPLTTLGLMVTTPDVPVFLFWALGVYLFWQTLQSQKTGLWYLVGVCFGLALVSKYTSILMAPCFLLYLVLTDERRWLKTAHPYLALLLGFACFLPVLYWNSQHDWVSFTFQLRNGLDSQTYSLAKVGEYVGGQMLLTNPIAWVMGMGLALVAIFRKDKRVLFVLCMSVPVIVFFGVSSLKKAAGANWPAFAYFTFSILVSYYCFHGVSRLRRVLWAIAVLTSLSLSMAITLHARFQWIPLESLSKGLATVDATNSFYGWKELVDTLRKQYPDRHEVITPSHQLSAEVVYYSQGSLLARTARITRPSQFNLWDWTHDLDGTQGLYLWSVEDYIGPDAPSFVSPAVSLPIAVHRGRHIVRSYFLIPGHPGQTPPFPGN